LHPLIHTTLLSPESPAIAPTPLLHPSFPIPLSPANKKNLS
jgi:hypothetical protein